MANYDSNYAIAQEISARIGDSPISFDSVYSICLEIYRQLGGEESGFDSVYSILLEILPLTGGIAHIDDSTISSGSTWSSAKIDYEIQQGGGGGGQPDLMVNVTYSQLKSLRDNSQLVKGQRYRITDYVTTVDKENMKSGNHQFDVIVTADDVNKLNENAKAINHDFSGQTVTYHKWMYDNTGEAWILSNEDSYTNEVSGTCPLEDTPMYGMEYYTNVYPIEGVIGVDDEVPYTPQVYRKAIILTDGNTLYLGDYIDEDKWNYWVEEGEAEGDYPEWFIGKYFLDDADTYSYDGTYVEGEDYFHQESVEPLHIWLTHNENTDVQYKIYTEERNYSNSVAGVCEITGEWEGLDYYTVGYPIVGVEYVDGESGAYLNDEKRILYTDNDSLVFGDSPYNFLLEKYNEETEAGIEHEYTLEQIEWFNGKLFEDVGDTEQFATTYEGVTDGGVNAKLNSWELKYCLDNDTDRFDWAQEGNAGLGFAAIYAYGESEGMGNVFKRYPEGDNENGYAWVYLLSEGSADGIEYVEDWDNLETSVLAYSASEVLSIGDEVVVYGYASESFNAEIQEYSPNVGEVPSGKGVIYYMKDEFNNECDYDFKNIIKTNLQEVVIFWDWDVYYAVRCPELDFQNNASEGDNWYSYNYAWILNHYQGTPNRNMYLSTQGSCYDGAEVNYCSLNSVTDWNGEVVYFPKSTFDVNDLFMSNLEGDDCSYYLAIVDTAIVSTYTFGNPKSGKPSDDSLKGNSNNNSISSTISDGIIVLPYTTLFEGSTYYQNRVKQLEAGNHVSISDNKINVNLPTANEYQSGIMRVGEGLRVTNWNYGTVALYSATASRLGGIKVGSGLSVNGSGVLSANIPSVPSYSAGEGLVLDNYVFSLNPIVLNVIKKIVQDEYDTYPIEKQYLTFEAIEDDTDVLFINSAGGGSGGGDARTIYVSTDLVTWISKTAAVGGVVIANLNAGEKVYVKGNNQNYFTTGGSMSIWVHENRFDATKQCYLYGNIMSLVQDNGFESLTSVAPNAFGYMFRSTSNLKSHQTKQLLLPATTLGSNCYHGMFYQCTSLTTAPELPATTLVNTCYDYMFAYCSSLNYIKCLATDISASNCTNEWLFNVPSGGTFVTPQSTNWSTGRSGIPSGWTRVDYVEPSA